MFLSVRFDQVNLDDQVVVDVEDPPETVTDVLATDGRVTLVLTDGASFTRPPEYPVTLWED
jgi:hypothetical protein